MLVTVFRSRPNPAAQEEYAQWSARMSDLAKTIPGYVSHKGFIAADGEKATIVEFETEEEMRIWATHPEHVEAKKKGRNTFFTEYRVQVCRVERETAFPKK